MDLGLDGKACIVTGASRGIGAATARMLADEGARVLRVARSDADLELDVTEPDAGDRAVEACLERFGAVDVLVNNAGTSYARPLEELTDDDWQGQWDLHVMASLRLIRAAAPLMADAGAGRVVNVCSSAGKRPSLTNAAYSVTKAAQLSLSRVFADSYASDDVLVNAVAPGAVASDLWTGAGGLAEQIAAARGGTRDDALAAQADKIPLGRLAEPREIADIVVFLCSARASNVTGAAWSADGGTVPIIV